MTINRPSIPLIDGVGALSASWLQSVLVLAGFADAKVAHFDARPIGAGNVSDTVRATLFYASVSAAPGSIVCKFRCSDPLAHAHGIGSGSYGREVSSYRALAAAGCECRIPQVLWVDGHEENINLVMEDLTLGTRAGNQIAGCSLADARAVVRELAKLHRAFYPMAREAAPAWAMTMAETADYWTGAIQRGLPIVRETVGERLSAEELAVVDLAALRAPAWYAQPVARGALTHGDPRVDNIIFRDGAGGPEAIIIDWQMTGWRSPMHDLGYFLSGSVSVEDRRAGEADLLDFYAAIVGADYPRAAIDEDYRLHLPSGLMTTLAAYGVLPMSPEVDALLIALLQRNIAAVADWHSLDALAG